MIPRAKAQASFAWSPLFFWSAIKADRHEQPMTADRWSGQNEKKYRKEKMLKKFTEGNLPLHPVTTLN